MNKSPATRKPKHTILSHLPSVDSVINADEVIRFRASLSHEFIVGIVRKEIDTLRKRAADNHLPARLTKEKLKNYLLGEITSTLTQKLRGSLVHAINATGVILHTGLGRAPLSRQAIKHINDILSGYSTLEINRNSGARGRRDAYLEEVFSFLTGAEAACVVNNNAAAIMLTLHALTKNKEVIISRGQLVEIGGSFRMPDVMEASGAKMIEVGTTNKTKLSDYEQAINRKTGAILLVHTSNYRVMGFTHEVALRELAALAKSKRILLIYDVGGGVLFDLTQFGLPYEPVIEDMVKQGADVVTFSGDKVLGGPQAGIIVGRKKTIDKIRKDPIARALRCDKLVLAGLEGTMRSYQSGKREFKQLPGIKMLLESVEKTRARAEKLIEFLSASQVKKLRLRIEETEAEIGSGAMPLEKIQSTAVTLNPTNMTATELSASLRNAPTPIFGYIKNNKVYLDMKTVFTKELPVIANVLQNLAH